MSIDNSRGTEYVKRRVAKQISRVPAEACANIFFKELLTVYKVSG